MSDIIAVCGTELSGIGGLATYDYTGGTLTLVNRLSIGGNGRISSSVVFAPSGVISEDWRVIRRADPDNLNPWVTL